MKTIQILLCGLSILLYLALESTKGSVRSNAHMRLEEKVEGKRNGKKKSAFQEEDEK